MSNDQYTIDLHWKPLLVSSTSGQSGVLSGWENVSEANPVFCEAPIKRLEEYASPDPKHANGVPKIILISSPGAVGKTTLARQMAACTGAMLVDLAKAGPVGENTLAGGLLHTELAQAFFHGDASIIVDGLDEARMQVPAASFKSFIADVLKCTKKSVNTKPIVLLGRTEAVIETWALIEDEAHTDVFQIDYYGEEKAVEFVTTQIAHKSQRKVNDVMSQAIKLYLEKIQEQIKPGIQSDNAASFAGYSPVLLAVTSDLVTKRGNRFDQVNPSDIMQRLHAGKQEISFKQISDAILDREHGKVANLQSDQDWLPNTRTNQSAMENLYTPAEQIARLAHATYQTGEYPVTNLVHRLDQNQYKEAIDRWMSEHPFLDQTTGSPSPLFGGYIAVEALRDAGIKESALAEEFSRGIATNPFISDFYMEILASAGDHPLIPAEHVGLLYASVRARLSSGESAGLSIDEEQHEETNQHDSNEDQTKNRHSIEIDAGRKEGRIYIAEGNKFVFGSQVANVEIESSVAEVSIGASANRGVVFAAPVSIKADKIDISVSEVVAETLRTSGTINREKSFSTVFLCAKQINAHQERITIYCYNATLEIALRDGSSHSLPWQFEEFFVNPVTPQPDIAEPLRRLKKMLAILRPFGGRFGKECVAIDAERSIKGSGQAVLNQLLEYGVFHRESGYYYLDVGRLTEKVGLNLADVHGPDYSEKTVEFLTRAIKPR